VEIDLTHEVLGRRTDAPHDKYRRHIITAVTLVIGLVVGGVAGVTMRQKKDEIGSVLLASVSLAGTNLRPVLQWSLANFGSRDAQVQSVLVDEVRAVMESPTIRGRSITRFTTPLHCGNRDPQLAITVIGSDGQSHEMGYLVNKADWTRLCS